MKLKRLSVSPHKPCYLLKFRGAKILLDCAADFSSFGYFVPHSHIANDEILEAGASNPKRRKVTSSDEEDEQGVLVYREGQPFIDAVPELTVPDFDSIDVGSIDAVLISSFYNAFALPYLTSRPNFRAPIYATEPTIQLCRILFDELVTLSSRSTNRNELRKVGGTSVTEDQSTSRRTSARLRASSTRLQRIATRCGIDVSLIRRHWRPPFNEAAVRHCFSRMRAVGFHERLDVLGRVQAVASSASCAIGSANWQVTFVDSVDTDRFVYIAQTSTLVTHPMPFDSSSLSNADCVLFNGLCQASSYDPDKMIFECAKQLTATVENGGTALVACTSAGILYDLFELVSQSAVLADFNRYYFISPIAKATLAYSNIYAEWLSLPKQNKACQPEMPFPHGDMQQSGQLRCFPAINADFGTHFHQPAIVFAAHSSLRVGDAVHFVKLLGSTPQNTIILPDAECASAEYAARLLAPFQPLQCKTVLCPIDIAFTHVHANRVLHDLKPKRLIFPAEYNRMPQLAVGQHAKPSSSTNRIEQPNSLTIDSSQTLHVTIRREAARIELPHTVANSCVPSEIAPRTYLAVVDARVTCRNNRFLLETPDSGSEKSREVGADSSSSNRQREESEKAKSHAPRFCFGQLDVAQFARELTAAGFAEVRVDKQNEDPAHGGYIITPSDDALIQVDNGTTHIICDDEEQRCKIRDALTRCIDCV